MDLTYPEEAERFRAEIRAWLGRELPADWFDGRRPAGDDAHAFAEASRIATSRLFPDGQAEDGTPQ